MRQWVLGLVCVLAGVGAGACARFDDEPSVRFTDYGTVVATGPGRDGYSIDRDDGVAVYIRTNLVPGATVTDGGRVRFNYEVLKEFTTGAGRACDIKLYGIDAIETLRPVRLSESGDGGDDPVAVTGYWITGRYLNLKYDFLHRQGLPLGRHSVSLVWDDTDGAAVNRAAVVDGNTDPVTFIFRHDGGGAVPGEGGTTGFARESGVVSFDLSAAVSAGDGPVGIKLMWTEYGKTWNETVPKEAEMKYDYCR